MRKKLEDFKDYSLADISLELDAWEEHKRTTREKIRSLEAQLAEAENVIALLSAEKKRHVEEYNKQLKGTRKTDDGS